MKTNILVQYDGGGYDGCIWEWNFFYIDADGTFHDIASSGVGGIDNLKDAEQLLKDSGNSFSSKVFIYRLDNKEDLRSFATESACPHVKGVLRWFNDYNSPDAEPFAVCSQCKRRIFDADDVYLVDIHGCGGIMSTADNMVCSDCYTTCDGCGGYCQDISEYEDQYLCEYCLKDQKQQKEQDEHETLLFVSMTTGTPDMFSDEMRWFWI